MIGTYDKVVGYFCPMEVAVSFLISCGSNFLVLKTFSKPSSLNLP